MRRRLHHVGRLDRPEETVHQARSALAPKGGVQLSRLMSPSISSVRQPASAKDNARFAEMSDFPSPGHGLVTVTRNGECGSAACVNPRRIVRNASTTADAFDLGVALLHFLDRRDSAEDVETELVGDLVGIANASIETVQQNGQREPHRCSP